MKARANVKTARVELDSARAALVARFWLPDHANSSYTQAEGCGTGQAGAG